MSRRIAEKVKSRSKPKKKIKPAAQSPCRNNEDLKKYGQPLDYTYLMGTYMAVNAVPGTVILIDGPDCAMGKVEHIFGKHDMGSTLLECTGLNRVECSFTDARNTVLSREKAVHQNMLALAQRKDVRAILLSSLPMTFVTGTDYNMIMQGVAKETEKPLHYIAPRSLNGGHLEGYDEVLRTLAEDLPLKKGATKKGRVAIVGYFMDRMEGDHRANLVQLRRMVEALGLDLCSVWLDGCSYEDLSNVQSAETILSFPYGRKAAKLIAKKTGAHLLEVGLPIGLDGTKRWLMSVAKELGCLAQADAFVEAELKRVIPRLEWIVPHAFTNKKFWVSCDPYLISPMTAFLEELGGIFLGGATVGEQIDVRAGRARGKKSNKSILPAHVARALVRPTSGLLEEDIRRACLEGVDVVIGNSDVTQLVPRTVPVMEFGYPSYFWHAFQDSPFMGFEGAVAVVDRIANALNAHRAPRADRLDYKTGTTIRSG